MLSKIRFYLLQDGCKDLKGPENALNKMRIRDYQACQLILDERKALYVEELSKPRVHPRNSLIQKPWF